MYWPGKLLVHCHQRGDIEFINTDASGTYEGLAP
jgi:hypothetical protein